MNEIEKKVIAIGGVGVTPESDKNLDVFILSQLKKTKNNIGFLATASEDDDEIIEKFYKKFENNNSDLSHFNLTSSVDGFSKWLLSKDLVYVGSSHHIYQMQHMLDLKLHFQIFYIVYQDLY